MTIVGKDHYYVICDNDNNVIKLADVVVFGFKVNMYCIFDTEVEAINTLVSLEERYGETGNRVQKILQFNDPLKGKQKLYANRSA